jgi:uncharacterized repeat protein (TIGR03803 family)
MKACRKFQADLALSRALGRATMNTGWRPPLNRLLLGSELIFASLLLTSSSAAAAAVPYVQLRSFTARGNSGTTPDGPLLEGSDGALYGVTHGGGAYPDPWFYGGLGGTVFKINKDGSGHTVLHQFGQITDGAMPQGGLLESSDGALYGTTSYGTNYSTSGTVFRINKDGSGYRILHQFASNSDGYYPQSSLVEGSDGGLYGLCSLGGAIPGAFQGTVYRISTDGSDYRILHSFEGAPDGQDPVTVLAGGDGTLYGCTWAGGTGSALPTDQGEGIVFKLNIDGTGYNVLHTFDREVDGVALPVSLTEGPNGSLVGTDEYGELFSLNKDGSGFFVLRESATRNNAQPVAFGSTRNGGTNEAGTLFRLNGDTDSYFVIHTFAGDQPTGVFQARDGFLYGMTALGGSNHLGTVFKLDAEGADYALLHTFSGGEGNYPQSGLIQGSDQALYGTLSAGGQKDQGAIFKISRDGSGYTELWQDFGTSPGASGPGAVQIIEGKDGALYGTTQWSGAGSGTVFRLNKDGSGYEILHRFADQLAIDGQYPIAPLVEDSAESLYGTTPAGGTSNHGTIFSIHPDGSHYQLLYSFEIPNGGSKAALVSASDGALYGTSLYGGNTNQGGFMDPTSGVGTIFKLNKDGSGYTVLYSFGASTNDARFPLALIEAGDGELYGTASGGGHFTNGAVFKLNKDGCGYSVLHDFGNGSDGQYPQGSLMEGIDGALYGLTSAGGTFGDGTAFKLNKDGSGYRQLVSFGDGPQDGVGPVGLVEGQDGTFYGLTAMGGTQNLGSVFKVYPTETPLMMGVVLREGAAVVSFSGEAGYAYQIQRSNDFHFWSVVDSIIMPAAGVYTSTDRSPDLFHAAYRVMWVPSR